MLRVPTSIFVIAGLAAIGLMLVGGLGIKSGHADAGCGGCIWLAVGAAILIVDVLALVIYQSHGW
jgi:hypothetical protein